MSIKVVINDLPRNLRESIISRIQKAFSEAKGDWVASVKSDPRNHAWDVEVRGPRKSHWERRFSGADRDPEVVAEAIREATGTRLAELSNALSELAVQGIAFLRKTDEAGEHSYVVDRVQLKESEFVYLHNQRALTRRGIQRYLLNRIAA